MKPGSVLAAAGFRPHALLLGEREDFMVYREQIRNLDVSIAGRQVSVPEECKLLKVECAVGQ